MDALTIEVGLDIGQFKSGIEAIKGELGKLQTEVNRIVASMKSAGGATGGASRAGSGSTGSGRTKNSIDAEIAAHKAETAAIRDLTTANAGLTRSFNEGAIARRQSRLASAGVSEADQKLVASAQRGMLDIRRFAREKETVAKESANALGKLRESEIRENIRALDVQRKEALRIEKDNARALDAQRKLTLRDNVQALNAQRKQSVNINRSETNLAALQQENKLLAQARTNGLGYAEAMRFVKRETEAVAQPTKTLADGVRAAHLESEKLRGSFAENDKVAGSFFGKIGSFLLRFAAFTISAGILIRVVFGIQQAITGIVERAITFQRTMETAGFALTAILTNSRLLQTSTGLVADITASYPVFLQKAKQFQQELLILNIKTLGTGEELQGVFQRVLAFSQTQKANDEERLRLTQNITNAAKLLGLSGEQINTETRQLLTLESERGQTILQSLGVTAKQLRVYRDQGTLVQKLNDLLKVYSVVADDVALTFDGLVSTVSTFVDLIAGAAFEQTFGGLKDILKGMADELQRLTKSGNLFVGLDSTTEDLKAFGASAANSIANFIRLIAEATNAIIDFAVKHRDSIQVVINSIEGFARVLAAPFNIIDSLITKVEDYISVLLDLGKTLRNLPSPENFFQNQSNSVTTQAEAAKQQSGSGGVGQAIGGAIAGTAVAATLIGLGKLGALAVGALNPVVLVLGAITGAAIAVDIQLKKSRESLVRYGELKNIFIGLATSVDAFGATTPKTVDELNDFLKQSVAITKQLELLKGKFATSGQEGADVFVKLLEEMIQKIAAVTGGMEVMKASLVALIPPDALKELEKLVKQLDKAAIARDKAKGSADITVGGIAAGKSEAQIEIDKARFEATVDFSPEDEKKITNAIEERNKALERQVKLQGQYSQAIASQDNLVQIPEVAKNLDAITSQLDDSKVLEGIRNFQDFKNSIAGLAESTELEKQRAKGAEQAEKDRKKAIEDTIQALADLEEKEAQANRQFEKQLATFSQNPGGALGARLDEIHREADEETTKLAKKFKGNVPDNVQFQVDKVSIAKARLAIVESIHEEEKLAQERIDIAERTQKKLAEISKNELDIEQLVSESRKSLLEDELNLAENNAGISGKPNNSLEDRARLMREIGDEEVKLINLDILREQANIDSLQAQNDRLHFELLKLEEQRREKIKGLKELSGGLTPEQEVSLNSGFDNQRKSIELEVKVNASQAQKGEAIIQSLGDKTVRVVKNTQNAIDDLGKTVIDFNNPIANAFGNLFDSLSKGGKGLKNVFKTLQKDIQQSFSDAFRESIKKKLQFDVEFKGNIFDLGGYFKDTFSKAVSYVGDLFSQAGGSGQGGFLSSLFSMFGSGSGGGGGMFSNVQAGGSSTAGSSPSLFSGGGSDLGSMFGFGSGGGNNTPVGGWKYTGTTTASQFPVGPGQPSTTGGTFAGGGAGGYAGLAQAGARIGYNFSQGNYGAGAGGTVGAGIGAYIGGPQGAAIGEQIGEMIGGIFDSIAQLFSKPGRIEKEKKKIIKFYEEVLNVDFSTLKEKKVAAGFEQYKGPTSAAAIALGSQFATDQKNPTQGTIVRFAGQGLGNFKKAGYDIKEAQDAILDLASAMDFDLKSGVKALKTNISEGTLSLKTFKEELKESKKNLKEYGDTSNLTAKELSDLATANGNTGSRLVTINEVLAGTIDIYAEFDEFVNGAAIANTYLANSFTETAKATGLFNADIESLSGKIADGTLSLEEGTIELNRFRKEAGLAALDLGDFKISAKDLQKQVDTIKKAVQSLRDGLKAGLTNATTAIDFDPAVTEKNFKKVVYQSMVDAVAEGMVDGIIKGSLAAGPISAAFQNINDITAKFVAGTITEGDFYSGLKDAFTAAGPSVDRLAIALGTSSQYLRQMLADAGVLPFLLDDAVVEATDLEKALHEAGKGAILEGLKVPEFDAKSVQKSFRRAIYGSLVDTIVDGFIDGFIKATLATGPLEAAMKNIKGLIDRFVSGDINFDQFGQMLSGELGNITPLIDRIATALGLATESLRNILDSAGILPDILDEANDNAKDLAKELRQAAKDLLLDPTLSPLKPKQRVAEAQATFEELRTKALAGDKDAAKKLPEAARQYLEEARKVFASSAQYEKIFDFVRGSLLDVADKFGPLEDNEEKQLRTLEDVRDYLKSVDITLKRMNGENPSDPLNPNRPNPTPGANFGMTGPASTWHTNPNANPPPGSNYIPGSNFGMGGPASAWRKPNTPGSSGGNLYNNTDPTPPPIGNNQNTDPAVTLKEIAASVKDLIAVATASNANSILSTINQQLVKTHDWIVFASIHSYNRLVNIMNLLSRIAQLPSNTPPFEHLAQGGIVTGYGVPAVLHGPEAVIPLTQENMKTFFNRNQESSIPIPYGGSQNSTFVSPELIEEIRGLRKDVRESDRANDDRPIIVRGDVHIGQEKIGQIVQKSVQGGLNRQQIRVPQASIITR